MTTDMKSLHELGQSIWLDYIRRDLIESGELANRIATGEIRGVTSNPTIFANAIEGSELYTADLRSMAQAGWEPVRIFDALSIDDIRAATGVFLPLYEETNGGDGFVSIEVNPRLADNTRQTMLEARRLWEAINRPNVMIKIPATKAGVPAIEQAIAEGINVNVTLIFSLDRYSEVMEAYLRGLETRVEQGASLDHVASVASFFISRIDSAVDTLLEEIIRDEKPNAERAAALLGKAAIASAKLAYAQFKATFSGPRFEFLAHRGARFQRPLWASTSTKNPNYPDTYYVDNLIGSHTVNTIPPNTLKAFHDHGTTEQTLEQDLSVSRAQLEALRELGISIHEVTDHLEREGVAKFAGSYTSLIKTLRKRARSLRKELASILPVLQQTLDALEREGISRRLWEGDTSLWTQQPAAANEVNERLGWLTLPQEMALQLGDLFEFRDEVRKSGRSTIVLLGMGGSSLTGDVLRRTLASPKEIEFHVLDSTDPAAISRVVRQAPVDKTLFIVASKSGTTTEPLALMEYFWARAKRRRGDKAGEHFVAITDPGTPLETLAHDRGFLRVFSAPNNVGGRYSALSVFGVLPAALMDVDAHGLLVGGRRMARACGPEVNPTRNPGLFLGALMYAATSQGRDKLTLVADPSLGPLADWIEQLIAESTGKQGKGIVPVVGEPPGPARVYSGDRLIIYLRKNGMLDRRVRGWIRAKLPVVVLEMEDDAQGFGQAFFLWEMATAVACHLLGVNAFDQPDVQKAKDSTAELLKAYRKRGSLPRLDKLWQTEGVEITGVSSDPLDFSSDSLRELMIRIFKDVDGYKHLVFLVYMRQENALLKRITRVRRALRDRFGVVTTMGFGPRYLHSTGQLHKGGPDSSLYLVITAEPVKDFEIPQMDVTFGILEKAQATGDLKALLALGRRAYGLHLDSPKRFRELTSAILKAIEQS